MTTNKNLNKFMRYSSKKSPIKTNVFDDTFITTCREIFQKLPITLKSSCKIASISLKNSQSLDYTSKCLPMEFYMHVANPAISLIKIQREFLMY